MRNSSTRRLGLIAAVCLLTVSFGTPAAPSAAREKMKAEDVVAKHLEAVGQAETLASIKSRVINGLATVNLRAPRVAQASGRVLLASQGEKNLLTVIFESTDYPQDKISFDGQDVTTSYVRPGVRSALGDFLTTQKTILRSGLLGGVLSDSWPLYDLSRGKPKLDYGGLKKIGDRQVHELKFSPRGGADIKINLFFEAETFRHVRTEYTRVISAMMGGSPDASAGQRETRYKLVEDFADFEKVSGLTLPHGYKLKLELDTRGGTYVSEWDFRLINFAFNQRIDPGYFGAATIR